MSEWQRGYTNETASTYPPVEGPAPNETTAEAWRRKARNHRRWIAWYNARGDSYSALRVERHAEACEMHVSGPT